MESEFNVYVLGAQRPTPGPGAYKIPSTIGNGPRASISPRYQTSQKRSDPSLVAVPSTFGSGPKISLGFRPHQPKQLETPGPDYVPPAFGSNSPRLSFPKAKRNKRKAKSKATPGPGQYNVKHEEFGSGAKMGSIPHSPRSTVFNKKANDTPVYAPKYGEIMKSSPRYSIGNRPREKATFAEGSGYAPPGSTLTGKSSEFPHAGRKNVIH